MLIAASGGALGQFLSAWRKIDARIVSPAMNSPVIQHLGSLLTQVRSQKDGLLQVSNPAALASRRTKVQCSCAHNAYKVRAAPEKAQRATVVYDDYLALSTAQAIKTRCFEVSVVQSDRL